ncbi:MAG: AMP-binding protein, partial [Candidatus Dormibacteraceae bacterium]
VLHERFDPAHVLADTLRYQITDLTLLPPLLYRILDDPTAATTDTSSLRQVGYGGCAASPTRIAQALERFGPILFQVYAQNECGVISALTRTDHLRSELLNTVGRPAPGIEVTIRDSVGKEVEPGCPGEICVRSAMANAGYWRNLELTAQVWRDGRIHTGDMGYLDAEGYLHVNDRLKDMIIVVGGHVYPTELEEVLLTHPAITQAAVYGVRDVDAIERMHAALVLRSGHKLDLPEVQKHVEATLGKMYSPYRIELLDQIPLTDAGKPDKKLLRARMTARIL